MEPISTISDRLVRHQPQQSATEAAMDSSAPARGVPARTFILAAGTFAVGTDAFVVAGVLPQIAGSLRVSTAEAGQLVTVFAITYALLSPVLATLTGNWPRRKVLLTALGIFVLGNVATALAPSYGWVLLARALAAVGATMFTPIASATAAAMVGPEHRARAISTVTVGMTLSMALGVPIGTLLATVMTWKGTMWFLAALEAVAALAVALWLPVVATPPAYGLRQRLAPLRDRRVVAVLLTTVTLFTGIFVVYTYIGVILNAATGGSGGKLAILLFVAGCAGTVGNLVAGKLTDRLGARRVIAVAAMIVAVNYAVLPVASATFVGAVLAMAIYGLTVWSITTPQQHRLIALAPSAASLVISLNASGIYLAVSLSGIIGAAALQIVNPSSLAWLAAVFVILGLAGSELAHRLAVPT